MRSRKRWQGCIGCACLLILCLFLFLGMVTLATRAEETKLFANPERVTLRDYTGDAMEPFLSRDDHYLFFNNRNDPTVNTNLYYAERIDDLTFQFRGEIKGVNTPALEGVPTMDRSNVFYFVSTRAYKQTFSTLYRGHFAKGALTGVELVPGISQQKAGIVNFDIEVSTDGNTLYFVDSRFENGEPQYAHLMIAARHGDTFERLANSNAIMKNVNSEKMQYAACISADELTLFFTQVRLGIPPAPAIFMATRRDRASPFGKPLKVAAAEGFVEGPTLSRDEKSLYYHKREGDKFVIYRVTRK